MTSSITPASAVPEHNERPERGKLVRLWRWLTEPLLDRKSLQRALSYRDAMRVRQYGAAAQAREKAARNLDASQDTAALSLYREAFGLSVSALLVGRGETVTEPLPPKVAWLKLSSALGALGKVPKQLAPLESVFTSDDTLAPDRLSARELRRRRAQAEAVLRWLSRNYELRTPRRIRVMRVLKVFVVTVVPTGLGIAAIVVTCLPKNVSRDKPAIASSSRGRGAPATGATDGIIDDRCAFLTNDEKEPWLRVDLLRYYSLSKVVVYNRGNGPYDDSLPLVLEISADGDNFKEVQTRTEPFTKPSPWKAKLSGELARYVRIRSKKNPGHLCFSEIEVYGKPQ